MHVFNKYLYSGFGWKSLIGRCRAFSLEWFLLSSIVLILLNLSCAYVISTALVLPLACFSALSLVSSLYYRFWGCGVITCIFFPIYSYVCIQYSSPIVLSYGVLLSFLLSFTMFILSVSIVREAYREQEDKYAHLSEEYTKIQLSYDQLALDKSRSCESLEKHIQLLQCELDACRAFLQQVRKEQENTALDLQILSDQKNSWLEDYALLHNKYLHLVSGDETTSVFSWVSQQEGPLHSSQDESQVLLLALREKEEEVTALGKKLEEERLLRQGLESESFDVRLCKQEIGDLENRLAECQHALGERERELLQLKSSKHAEGDEYKAYKNKYLQLREQFNEKSEMIVQVRKELFSVNEHYLTLQREREHALDDDMSHVHMIHKLLLRIEGLEEEIVTLEELISHSLFL